MLDLTSAFDSIDYSLLLHSLVEGFQGKALGCHHHLQLSSYCLWFTPRLHLAPFSFLYICWVKSSTNTEFHIIVAQMIRGRTYLRKPGDTRSLNTLFDRIKDVKSWLAKIFLQLNENKSDV